MNGWTTGVRTAALVILCTMLLPGCRRSEAPAEQPPLENIVPVGAVPAQTAGIRAVVHASGVVAPSEGGEFLVVAPEPARVVEVAFSQGDSVNSGDLLARFDVPSARQDVARLAADLSAGEAQLENARVNQGRVRDFVERGLVPRRDLEVADRELADAAAAVERIRIQHTAAVAAEGRAIVRAPFAGIVAARWHNPGDVVVSPSADPVLRLVDPRRLDVIAEVPEADVSRVVPGASARIAAAEGTEPIRLTVVRREAERVADRMLPFRLVFNEPATVAVDTRVEIDIDAEERANAVLVPLEAVMTQGAESVVMVANGDRAERRVVTLGIEDVQRVEVTSGLRAGELVITRGHLGLADGAAISVATVR